jgi:hypothetical protein
LLRNNYERIRINMWNAYKHFHLRRKSENNTQAYKHNKDLESIIKINKDEGKKTIFQNAILR